MYKKPASANRRGLFVEKKKKKSAFLLKNCVFFGRLKNYSYFCIFF